MRYFLYKNLGPNYRIEQARDGEEALAKSFECIPDLIVTDLMMPKLDGLNFCLKIKADHRTSHVPVIMLTAKASHESRIEGLKSGADDYLEKPFKIAELKVRIENLISQREKLKEKYSKMFGIFYQNFELNNVDEIFLKKAFDIVIQNMSSVDWGVEEFSNCMSMSRSQLFRKVKALTDMSVTDYILAIRLSHAAHMLEKNAGNITEVAFNSGFNDSSYFSKCFKKKYGISPRAYTLKYSNID